MRICAALLKYGYSLFSLEILEYCEPEKCLEREDYYFRILKPEYNISLTSSAPMLGRVHSDESRKKISVSNKGENHPMFGKSHFEETLAKMSDSHKKIKHPCHFKTGKSNPMFGQPRPKGAGILPQVIEVIDKENNDNKNTYPSIREAALALKILPSVITNYFKNNQKNPYKKRYIFVKK